MKHQKTISFCLLFLMDVALATGMAFAQPADPDVVPIPIRIGYQASPDWLLFVARDQKLFEKAGLAPTYVEFVAEGPMIAAAQNKTIDITSIGSVPFLVGLAEGVDWAMIGINPEGEYTEGVAVRKDSGIETLADLKGKRIGYQKGSTAHYGLIMILRQLGIRPDQVTLTNMRPAEQFTAMANKQIDAAMTWEPWLQKMVHGANARVLTTEGDMGIYTHVDGYAARRDWLRNNREAAVRFLRALLMAYDVLQKNPAIGNRVLAEELEIEQPWVETIYQNEPPPRMNLWIDPRYRYSLVKDSAFHRRLKYLASFLFDEKIIPIEVEVDHALDASIIEEALNSQKSGSLMASAESSSSLAVTPERFVPTRTQPSFRTDRIQVEIFSWWSTGREAAALQKLIDMFDAANSGAEVVNVAAVGMANAKQILDRRMLNGNPPDSFQVHMGHELLDTWVKTGYMEPLDDLYSKNELDQVISRRVLDMVTFDGHRWAVPVNIHRANVLWFSRDAFHQAGILKAPETWDEFFADAEKLKSVGITPLALGSKDSWPAAQLFEVILIGTLGPDGYSGLWTGKTRWDDPRVTEALNIFLKALSCANSDHDALTWDQAADLLIDGRAGMTIMLDSLSREFVIKKFTQYGWANAPGTAGVFDALSDTFGLPKGAKHPVLVKRFLTLLGSKTGQEAFNKLKGSICTRNDCDYSGFSDYQKSSASDWRKDTIVPSAVHGAAANNQWAAAFTAAIVDLMNSKDVAKTQQALVQAAAVASKE